VLARLRRKYDDNMALGVKVYGITREGYRTRRMRRREETAGKEL